MIRNRGLPWVDRDKLAPGLGDAVCLPDRLPMPTADLLIGGLSLLLSGLLAAAAAWLVGWL